MPMNKSICRCYGSKWSPLASRLSFWRHTMQQPETPNSTPPRAHTCRIFIYMTKSAGMPWSRLQVQWLSSLYVYMSQGTLVWMRLRRGNDPPQNDFKCSLAKCGRHLYVPQPLSWTHVTMKYTPSNAKCHTGIKISYTMIKCPCQQHR